MGVSFRRLVTRAIFVHRRRVDGFRRAGHVGPSRGGERNRTDEILRGPGISSAHRWQVSRSTRPCMACVVRLATSGACANRRDWIVEDDCLIASEFEAGRLQEWRWNASGSSHRFVR